jgi:putative heme-binding domain-containing protein
LSVTTFHESAFAQRDLKNIPDPDPEIERKSFQVADGFEVNLFAADPMLAKPIQMNWDAAGRLWVASSEVYPQIEPGQKANDKILVLEDSDGDGRADKTTVFADGLLIPTGVEPDYVGANGSSVFVANSTEILHLKDTDGDGKADTSRIVLSGFGTEDTHHIIHTFRWGHDGCLYFNQSIYIHSHIETPWGVRRLGGGGIWQFRPESWKLEVLCRGFVNTWGHHFDEWGQSFATDGAYGEGINYVFPGATFFTAPGATRILKGLNPGSPKHCGLEIVGGRHLPDDWQGNMLTNDFRGNRVCRFVVSEDGSGYASREMPELIKTSHVAFRPIDIKMGPDGAIYIADWYNPIIQHGEVDFRDPRRDHTHGRIWRVTAKDRALVERPKLVDATIEELLDQLKSPEPWTRHFAKRMLKGRGPSEVQPALKAWVSSLEPGDSRFEHHRLEALWTYQSIDVIEPELLATVLRSKDHRVRAAATRVLAMWHGNLDSPRSTGPEAIKEAPVRRVSQARETATQAARTQSSVPRTQPPESRTQYSVLRVPDSGDSPILKLLAEQVRDEHPRVRLEAVRALSLIPQPRSAELAMQALDRPMDQFVDFALWQTARDLQPHWLPVVQQASRSDEMGFGGNPRHIVFALQAIGTPAVVRPLVTLLREGTVPRENEDAVLSLVGSQGGPDDLGLVFDLVVAEGDASDTRRLNLLASLAKASRQRKVQPAGDLTRLVRLLADETDEQLRATAARTAGLWKLEPLRPQLDERAAARETPDELRRAAMEGIALLGGPASRASLETLCANEQPIVIRRMAVSALAGVDLRIAAAHATAILNDAKSDSDTSEIFRSFLERKDGPRALATALADRQLPADAAKIGIRLAKISGREQPELVAALTKAGALSAGPKQLSAEEVQTMVNDVVAHGDPARGEDIFRRKDLNCLKCHSIAGAGGQAGPDLLSIGASAQIDYLIDSLLDPNKQVKEGFHALVVATNDGRVLTGLKVRQTDGELVLRDAENREVPIPLNSIEEQKTGGSIMPIGLTDSLTRGELLDLVRFLSLLGKTDGPLVAGPARVARRWEVLDPTPEMAQQIRHGGPSSVARDAARFRWTPAASKVNGEFPLNDLVPMKIGYQSSELAFVRCQLDVTTPGKVKVRLNSAAGLQLWLDQTPIDPRAETSLDLQAGRHTLTFAVQTGERQVGVRIELEDVPGSLAKTQFTLGN